MFATRAQHATYSFISTNSKKDLIYEHKKLLGDDKKIQCDGFIIMLQKTWKLVQFVLRYLGWILTYITFVVPPRIMIFSDVYYLYFHRHFDLLIYSISAVNISIFLLYDVLHRSNSTFNFKFFLLLTLKYFMCAFKSSCLTMLNQASNIWYQ